MANYPLIVLWIIIGVFIILITLLVAVIYAKHQNKYNYPVNRPALDTVSEDTESTAATEPYIPLMAQILHKDQENLQKKNKQLNGQITNLQNDNSKLQQQLTNITKEKKNYPMK